MSVSHADAAIFKDCGMDFPIGVSELP